MSASPVDNGAEDSGANDDDRHEQHEAEAEQRGVVDPDKDRRGDYGPIDALPMGATRRGGYFIYSRSVDHPGHVYRWTPHSFKGGMTTGSLQCQNCRKIRKMAGGNADHTVTLVSVRRGRFSTNPDRPRKPHVCTIPGPDGTFDMFTEAHMHAEQFVIKIRDTMVDECSAGATPKRVFERLLATMHEHMPVEFVDRVKDLLPDYKTLRSTLARARQRSQAKALLDAALADDGDPTIVAQPLAPTHAAGPLHNGGLLCDTYEPQCAQLQQTAGHYDAGHLQQHNQQQQYHQQQPQAHHAAVGGHVQHLQAPHQPPAASLPPRKRPRALGGPGGSKACKQPKVEDPDEKLKADAEKAARVREARNKVRIATLRTALSDQSLGVQADGALKSAIQQAAVKHQMRIFSVKERAAERAAQYEEKIYAKELSQKELTDRINAEHLRECNKLARRRLQLENELLEAKVRKLRAETKEIEKGRALVKIECSHADEQRERDDDVAGLNGEMGHEHDDEQEEEDD